MSVHPKGQGGENMSIKCECPEKGILNSMIADWYDREKELPFVNHKPLECKCQNDIKLYSRKGKKMFLCSNCVLSMDIEEKDGKEEK